MPRFQRSMQPGVGVGYEERDPAEIEKKRHQAQAAVVGTLGAGAGLYGVLSKARSSYMESPESVQEAEGLARSTAKKFYDMAHKADEALGRGMRQFKEKELNRALDYYENHLKKLHHKFKEGTTTESKYTAGLGDFASAQAQRIWEGLQPEHQSLIGAQEFARKSHPADPGLIVATQYKLDQFKKMMGKQISDAARASMSETRNIIDETREKLEKADEMRQKWWKETGKSIYDEAMKFREKAESSGEKLLHPTQGGSFDPGLSRFVTPGNVAKAVGIGALAGGLYYGGSRLMSKKRDTEDQEKKAMTGFYKRAVAGGPSPRFPSMPAAMAEGLRDALRERGMMGEIQGMVVYRQPVNTGHETAQLASTVKPRNPLARPDDTPSTDRS